MSLIPLFVWACLCWPGNPPAVASRINLIPAPHRDDTGDEGWWLAQTNATLEAERLGYIKVIKKIRTDPNTVFTVATYLPHTVWLGMEPLPGLP